MSDRFKVIEAALIDARNSTFGPLSAIQTYEQALVALRELAKQEPVAVVDANDDGYWADILPDRSVKVGQQLYAAPKALEPVGYTDSTGIAFAVKWSGALPPNLTLYAAPKALEPLTDDEIWKNDALMSANSGYGATFETLRKIVRAVEAAHGIGGHNG